MRDLWVASHNLCVGKFLAYCDVFASFYFTFDFCFRHEAAIRQLDETYDMLVDKTSGRVYWLNKLTLESSYDDPYVAVGMKGTDRRREMQVRFQGLTHPEQLHHPVFMPLLLIYHIGVVMDRRTKPKLKANAMLKNLRGKLEAMEKMILRLLLGLLTFILSNFKATVSGCVNLLLTQPSQTLKKRCVLHVVRVTAITNCDVLCRLRASTVSYFLCLFLLECLLLCIDRRDNRY